MEKVSRRKQRKQRKAEKKAARILRASGNIAYESAYGDVTVELAPPWTAAVASGAGAVRRQKLREKRQRLQGWFQNLSLRVSFMAYMLIFLLTALLLCMLVTIGLEDARMDILSSYEMEGEAPVEYYYMVGDQILFSFEDGEVAFAPVSAGDQVAYTILGALMFLNIPVIALGCIFLAGILFYNHKLRKPIAELAAASVRIGENNLDFRIRYRNEDEMGQLCNSFESMRSALEENNREMWRQMEERRRLNAAFSHDLRTPLTVLRGQNELLRTYLPQGKIGQERALTTLQTMAGQIGRLERYVDAMQSAQRLSDLEVTRQFVAPAPFLQELREIAMLLCKQHAIHFTEAHDGGQLRIDPAVVMQVYENLLANAARYAVRELWVEYLHSEGLFCIRVQDDGPGFTAEGLQKAAQPFYRAEDNKRGGQFGLGLYICAVLCERHGGRLEITNREGGGACILASFMEK